MLDITGIRILCCLNRNYRQVSKRPADKLVTMDTIEKDLNLSSDDCHRCLEFLIESGYVKSYSTQKNIPVIWGYEPTWKGSHWFQFMTLGSLDFWFKSILVPLIVSLLTCWITSLLTA